MPCNKIVYFTDNKPIAVEKKEILSLKKLVAKTAMVIKDLKKTVQYPFKTLPSLFCH